MNNVDTRNLPRSRLDEVEGESRQVHKRLPPSEFLCPINLNVMQDPVACPDGNTYERNAILAWKRHAEVTGTPFTSPLTGERMGHGAMYPNYIIKSMISAFQQEK